jgi:prolyl oligopeptidase
MRKFRRDLSALAPILFLAVASSVSASTKYPPTKTVPVTDTYYGTVVADPYRWLENGKDPAVKAWAAAQSKLALSALRGTRAYATYRARIRQLSRTSTVRYGLTIAGGRLFYGKYTPPQQQPTLVVRDGLSGAERTLFDPSTAHIAAGEPEPAIETVSVAPDGSKVAFTTQSGGSEAERLHVADAATGTILPDTLPHVGGGESPVAIAWDGDGKGLLHTLWPMNADGSYATAGMLVYHHVFGTDPATDTYVFGKGQSPKSEYHLSTSLDGTVSALEVTDGDGVHASVYLRTGDGPFAQVATPAAGIGKSDTQGGHFVGDAYYAIAHGRDSRGEIVALLPGGSFESAKVIVPASSLVIGDVVPVAGGFLTSDIDGGAGAARLFATDGTLRQTLPIPPVSTITALAGDPRGGPIVFSSSGYTNPSKWLAYDPATNTTKDTGIDESAPAGFANIRSKRVFVPSLDGKVRIPLDIVFEKSLKLDSKAPTILYAYGAYGTISSPFFDPTLLAWLERGGIFAQAMIRGGGEYGDSWHEAAHLSSKTKSSDDLAACALWLEHNKYSSARHLGIKGGSAGGFLMGLATTRNPSIYRAVNSEVGIYDLIRVELTPNGAYNVTEFGTTKDPAQFAWMIKQSPYHNVHAGTAYPAVLMTTGENDPRVEPYNSRKFAAMLQAKTSSGLPIYLIQRAGAGHGMGSSLDQQIENVADFVSFFEKELR